MLQCCVAHQRSHDVDVRSNRQHQQDEVAHEKEVVRDGVHFSPRIGLRSRGAMKAEVHAIAAD
jgi:hypothetical protein